MRTHSLKPRRGFVSFLCDHPFCVRRASHVLVAPPLAQLTWAGRTGSARFEVCKAHKVYFQTLSDLFTKSEET